jgi:poly(hydroxyalkanoate) granule-associated protein
MESIMIKKIKSLTDNQLTKTVKDSAEQIKLAGVGAYNKAQKEGDKLFEALVKEGETVQKKTRKAAEEKIAVVTTKTTGTWDRLEQVFQDRVARSLSSLGVPSKKDIDKLSRRVAELTAVVHQLADTKEVAVKKVLKPVAAKVAAVSESRKAVVVKAAPAKQPAPPKSVTVDAAAPAAIAA